MRYLFFALLAGSLVGLANLPAQELGTGKVDWFKKSVKKLEASFEPAEAKPGQTVTWTLLVELHDDYITYPFSQPDPKAEFQVNQIKFPESGAAVFVGKVIDPPKFEKKAEPEIGIKELRYYKGKMAFQRKVVIHPEAKPGEISVKIPSLKLSVCDAKNCYALKTQMPEAKLKILAGPAVKVDEVYAEEVKQAKP
jgi:inner membrane protein involved in colicin E2 resistance